MAQRLQPQGERIRRSETPPRRFCVCETPPVPGGSPFLLQMLVFALVLGRSLGFLIKPPVALQT